MTSIYIADRRGKSMAIALSILLQKGYNITYDPPSPMSITDYWWDECLTVSHQKVS